MFEAIRTTRAMRRLDPDRAVPAADLRRVLEAATKGPTGGNRQPVRWLVWRGAGRRRGGPVRAGRGEGGWFRAHANSPGPGDDSAPPVAPVPAGVPRSDRARQA